MSDFYPECYHVVYGAQRPVRWSALETLQGGLCTLHSNVVRTMCYFISQKYYYKYLYTNNRTSLIDNTFIVLLDREWLMTNCHIIVRPFVICEMKQG